LLLRDSVKELSFLAVVTHLSTEGYYLLHDGMIVFVEQVPLYFFHEERTNVVLELFHHD
jgi:hypothetical protein